MAYGVNAPFGLRPISSINGGSWTEKTNEYSIFADANGANTYNASIFTGDPVVFSPARANVGTITRYLPAYTDATPSTFSVLPILGVFQGCEYTDVTGRLIKSPFWPASTLVYPGSTIRCWVIDDPEVVYDVQVSTHIAAVTPNFIGLPNFPNINGQANLNGGFGSNFALNVGGGGLFDTVVNAYTTATGKRYANNPADGSPITGQSAFYLDVATPTAGAATHDYNKTVATLPLKALGYTQHPNNIAATGLTLTTTPFLNVRVTINNHVFGHNSAGVTLA
jgi:hypothetical protein